METNTIQVSGELAMRFGLWSEHTGKLKFDNRVIAVSDVAEASRLWSEMRDSLGLRASESPAVMVVNTVTGEHVAKISYNGRAWGVDGKEIAL